MNKYKINLQPYKGTQDYYPEDMFKRNYLFNIWRETATQFGYEEYDTPLLEEANLYKAKSGEELGSTQLYNFIDKGGREIAIRPEMTPSLARLIAQRSNELSKPIRWFSIDKFYRFEKPQRGRAREFFQLNLDIFGIQSIQAELEVFMFINSVMNKLKAPTNSWAVYVNNRYLTEYFINDILKLSQDLKAPLYKAIDNYLKIKREEFKPYLIDIGLSEKQATLVLDIMNYSIEDIKQYKGKNRGVDELLRLFELTESLGLNNFIFKPYIIRGIAYYTGTVIEMFDIGSRENPRALFGGGRYDDLLDIFDKPKIPAFGIGWGNITMNDFLTTYNLYPEYSKGLYIYVLQSDDIEIKELFEISNIFRSKGYIVETSLEKKDIRKQLTYASKKQAKYSIMKLGDQYILKDMSKGEQKEFTTIQDLSSFSI